jgi:nucleoside 2-deoxyribosyltransferase
MSKQNNCPLCGSLARETSVPERSYSFYLYQCPSCGEFAIDADFVDSPDRLSEEQRIKASIVAAERKLHGRDRFFLQLPDSAEFVERYDYAPVSLRDFLNEFPSSGVDEFDRILLNLQKIISNVRGTLNLSSSAEIEQYKWLLHGSTVPEAYQILQEMKEMGFVSMDLAANYRIAYRGWERLRQLQKSTSSGTAFVAMWFDPETEPLRAAIKEAVRASGYNPQEITVDEAHHNDYIMDKVTNMINDARFVLADFTCVPEEAGGKGVRGGVYFEAGFARGRGKQVIHTCRDDDEAKSRLHFDVGQINTIFWKRDKTGRLRTGQHDLIEFLKERIIATVGHGPVNNQQKIT